MGVLYFPEHLMGVSKLYRRGYFLVEELSKNSGDLYAIMVLKCLIPQQWGELDDKVLTEGHEWGFDFVPYIPNESGQDERVVERISREYGLVITSFNPKITLEGSRASGLVATVQCGPVITRPGDKIYDQNQIVAGMISTAFRAGSTLPQIVKDNLRAE